MPNCGLFFVLGDHGKTDRYICSTVYKQNLYFAVFTSSCAAGHLWTGDTVVSRDNEGWSTWKGGQTCPRQNCSWRAPAEKIGRRSLLNRPSCPPEEKSGQGTNWTVQRMVKACSFKRGSENKNLVFSHTHTHTRTHTHTHLQRERERERERERDLAELLLVTIFLHTFQLGNCYPLTSIEVASCCHVMQTLTR